MIAQKQLIWIIAADRSLSGFIKTTNNRRFPTQGEKCPKNINYPGSTALLKVDFGSRSQSRVPDFYSTFVKKSTLKSTLLDFKSGKSDFDSTPPRRLDPYPKPYRQGCRPPHNAAKCQTKWKHIHHLIPPTLRTLATKWLHKLLLIFLKCFDKKPWHNHKNNILECTPT